jgi:hypothetical protein
MKVSLVVALVAVSAPRASASSLEDVTKIAPQPLMVESFHLADLQSPDHRPRLLHALTTTGLIAIHPSDTYTDTDSDNHDFGQTRDTAYEHMCRCFPNTSRIDVETARNTDPNSNDAADSVLLRDGQTTRTTWATATVGYDDPLTLPKSLQQQCGPDTVAALENLRDSVAHVSAAVVQALDQILIHDHHRQPGAPPLPPLLRTKYGGSYSSIHDIVQASQHLEHFHYYSKQREELPATTTTATDKTELHQQQHPYSLPLHTDAGLFLAFVPGQSCHQGRTSSNDQEDSSFLVQDDQGRLRRAVFSTTPSVVIMMGVGAEHWLQLPSHQRVSSSTTPSSSSSSSSSRSPLRATRHAVQMAAGDERVWYGMSTFRSSSRLFSRRVGGVWVHSLTLSLIFLCSALGARSCLGSNCSSRTNLC